MQTTLDNTEQKKALSSESLNLIKSSILSSPLPAVTTPSKFITNLPPGYQAFSGNVLYNGEAYSSHTGGIYGAPLPSPPIDGKSTFGNPNSRYLWVYPEDESFQSEIYNQILNDKTSSSKQIPPVFELDGDDALVLFGTTPDEIPYYSFTLYQTLKYAPDAPSQGLNGYVSVGASIGLSNNSSNLKTSNSPFNSQYALIVTSNTQTEQTIKNSLIASGVPESTINSYLFPAEFANAGISDNPSALSLLIRNTFQTESDKQKIDQYLENVLSLPQSLTFDENSILSYGGKPQDRKSKLTLENDNTTLKIKGNGWKAAPFSYTITPNTVLKFDFQSDVQGEIHGIGFDNDNKISSDRFFQLYGTESQGIDNFRQYQTGSGLQHYRIPVGEFFTGDMKFLTFINDHDILNPTAKSVFSNIKVYEEPSNPIIKAAFIEGPSIQGDVTEEQMPKWENQLQQNPIEYNLGLDNKLNALQENVISQYTQQGYVLKDVLTEEMRHVDPNVARENNTSAAYDSPDALYAKFTGGEEEGPDELGSVISLDNPNDILMILGVDHTTVGDGSLGTYFSYEMKSYAYYDPLTGETNSAEGLSFVGAYTQNSATQYLPADQASDLFAAKIIQSDQFGGGQPYTVNLPISSEVPPEYRKFSFLGRVYLDETIATAPNPENLIPARLLWFTPA